MSNDRSPDSEAARRCGRVGTLVRLCVGASARARWHVGASARLHEGASVGARWCVCAGVLARWCAKEDAACPLGTRHRRGMESVCVYLQSSPQSCGAVLLPHETHTHTPHVLSHTMCNDDGNGQRTHPWWNVWIAENRRPKM